MPYSDVHSWFLQHLYNIRQIGNCKPSQHVTRSTYASAAQWTHVACKQIYEGRPINKLQNGIILLIFKI